MKILRALCTIGPIGYVVAPGTMATIASLPIMWVMSSLSTWWYILSIAVCYVVANFAIKAVLSYFNSMDPSEIVIDEFIGTLVTFLGVPITADTVLVGVIFFRFFDISKIGLHWIEEQNSSHAIILDDVIAGLFANFLLHVLNGYGWF